MVTARNNDGLTKRLHDGLEWDGYGWKYPCIHIGVGLAFHGSEAAYPRRIRHWRYIGSFAKESSRQILVTRSKDRLDSSTDIVEACAEACDVSCPSEKSCEPPSTGLLNSFLDSCQKSEGINFAKYC